MKITMLSTSKRQAAVRRGSEKLSDRRYFKRIPTPEPVTANCRRSVTPDVWPSARLHRMLHRSSLSTIIVLIILSITKSYSALPTDVSTVASVLQHTTTNSSTAVNLVYQTSQHSGGGNDNNNSNSSSAEELWAKSANVTSGSTVDGQHVDNSSVFNEPPQSASSPATATVIDNPLQINESSWSINNSVQSTGGDHWHRQHSDLISHLHCEYGTIRKYSFSSVVQSRLTPNGSTRATVLVRCLDQVTWGVGDQQDRLNGQKYIVYISDFYSDPSGDNKQRTKRASLKERSKRSIYQTFEHLWSDIRSILPNYEEDSSSSHHDDFEQDLLRSMESELRSKCHSLLYWEKIQRPDKCLHCHANPSSKFSLPFWFIQLEDGTIPQIRFTKQEVNLDVKNFKKLITSLLATQLNSSNYDSVEKSVLGQHRSHYCPLNSTNYSDEQLETNISNAHIEPLIIERHIETTDFLFEQNKELPLSSDSFLNITATFTQHIDNDLKQIINSYGQVTTTFGPSDLSLYCTTIHEHQLEKEKVFNHKMGDVLNELQERYTESQKESLIGEANKEDTLLQEKYSDLLYRLRARLGRNEYHYYTKLFDAATKKGEEAEYDSLLRLVSLEQQLNHSMHQHNSLIGDLRRIGTIHNIQLVCSPTLLRLTDSDMCAAFLYLLLQSSSKTAQHVLLYSLQNQSGGEPSAKATMAARLLAQTYRPSRWLIENLAHEAHHQVNNRPMETALLQALTQIAQREQLVKLKELLSSHLLKRIRETLADVEPSPSGSFSSTTSELYTIDLLEMLGNLGNYTALQLVQEGLNLKWHSSDLVTIATIHAYRRSINRSQVQNQLSGLFLSANSCQIKQHIVQLLIDDVDLMFWSQTKDKRWPKYGFEPLDQILADELRNSSTNCVHHLILEYFKRKVNSKASKLVGEFKASHNVTASSFDFCITEASNYKCDYVQVLGNELASVEMRKSISISKPSTSLRLNGSSSARPQSTYIYAEHSLSTVISKYKLTVAHLSLIQIKSSEGKSRLRVQLQTSTGDTIPLANVPLDGSDLHHQQQQQQPTNASAVKIAQMKLTVPVKVAASEHSPQANNALLVSMEAYFAVYLQSHWQQADSELSEGTLRIQISLKSTGEFAYSGLALQRSIDLQCKFEYESKQPVEIWQTTRQSVIVENVSTKEQQARRRMTTTPTATNENEAIRLGSEAFAGQVQLWQHSNKQYDPQCNIWMERSERQQLSHWNSTVKQSNLFALPLQPLPLLTAELPAAVATNQPANASSIVVDEGASTAGKTT